MENQQESYSLHTEGDYLVFRLNEMALNLNLSPGYIDGSWHHVAATYGGATARVYVDGVERAQQAYSTPIASSGTKLVLGAYYSPTEAITGSMDEPAIYTSALSAARIQAHYQAGVSVP